MRCWRAQKPQIFLGKIFRHFVSADFVTKGSETAMAERKDMKNTAYMADLFGLGERRVEQLAKEGIITGNKTDSGYRFDLIPAVRQYIEYLSKRANGRNQKNGKTEEERLKAEADLKRSKADMAKLQLKELQGKMHRSEDVEAITMDLVYTIRGMIIALPGRLAVDAAAAQTAPEASEVIRRECFAVLEELSNYRYDPDEYARRVREREGWQELTDDNEE